MAIIPRSSESSMSPSASSCISLGRFPLEIRQEVYRHLLGRYTKRRLDMNSKEYDRRRKNILKGPDYSYRLDYSILAVNRQIRREALNLFEHEIGPFVTIIHHQLLIDTIFPRPMLHDCGTTVFATGDGACVFPRIAMTIDFEDGHYPTLNPRTFLGHHTVVVVSFEDPHAVCAYLQSKITESQRKSQPVRFRITISPNAENVLASLDARLVPDYRIMKCLEPLRHVRGANIVEIVGPFYHSYLADVKASMLRSRLRAPEVMELVGKHFDQGDSAFKEGNAETAIVEYKTALDTIRSIGTIQSMDTIHITSSMFRSNHFDPDFLETVVRGRFQGIRADFARHHASVRLHTLIADLYLQSGDFRLARVYVERVYGPLYIQEISSYYVKTPLRLPEHSNKALYANLFFIAARISLACGNLGQARYELEETLKLDPTKLEIEELLKYCKNELHERGERRRASQVHQQVCAMEKVLAAKRIARNRKAKGDIAFGNKDFQRARQKYEAAYAKLTDPKILHLERTSFTVKRGSNLELETLIALTIVSLKLNDHDSVHRWADAIIDDKLVDYHFLRELFRVNSIGILPYTVKATYTALYAKAIVFRNTNNFLAAIKHFEKALLCDRRCEASHYQLEILRRVVEAQTLDRKFNQEKAWREQNQEKKQEKKDRAKAAKAGRQRAKKARGQGYLIGIGSS